MVCLSNARYYGLAELETEWKVCSTTIRKWLMAGKLKAHIWLPLMSVFELKVRVEGEAVKIARILHHYEGLVPLTQYHCQRLFRSGLVTLREFKDVDRSSRYQLPDTTDDISANPEDLIILEDEKARFESEGGALAGERESSIRVLDDAFRTIEVDGEMHRFGAMQGAVLRHLYEAALDGQEWQSGKQVLHQVGSESFNLSNLFKHKPVWRRLIESDHTGRYRVAENVII